MRIVRFLIAYGVFSTFGIVVSLFVAQNTQPAQGVFFGQEVSPNLAWMILGAAACGFFVALVLLVPGRIAAAFHIWGLHREAREFEEHLAVQGERREQLLANHEWLLAGHERLLHAYHRAMTELDRVTNECHALGAKLSAASAANTAANTAANATGSDINYKRPPARASLPTAILEPQPTRRSPGSYATPPIARPVTPPLVPLVPPAAPSVAPAVAPPIPAPPIPAPPIPPIIPPVPPVAPRATYPPDPLLASPGPLFERALSDRVESHPVLDT